MRRRYYSGCVWQPYPDIPACAVNNASAKADKIQPNQNDADIFLRARAALKKSCAEIEIWSALVSLKESLDGKNRNIREKTEVLSRYQSQVFIVMEKFIDSGRLKDVGNYRNYLFNLKEKKRDSETCGNIERVCEPFLPELHRRKEKQRCAARFLR